MTATPQSLASEAHTKLALGWERLDKAGDDTELLGLALVSLHGALEDHYRAVLAEISPELRERVTDRREVQWRELLDLMTEHAGLPAQTRQQVMQTNALRQNVAHGGTFKVSRTQVEQYATLVQSLVGGPLPKRETQRQKTPDAAAPAAQAPVKPASRWPTPTPAVIRRLWIGSKPPIRWRALLATLVALATCSFAYGLALSTLRWPMPIKLVGVAALAVAAFAGVWGLVMIWRVLAQVGLRRLLIATPLLFVVIVLATALLRPSGEIGAGHWLASAGWVMRGIGGALSNIVEALLTAPDEIAFAATGQRTPLSNGTALAATPVVVDVVFEEDAPDTPVSAPTAAGQPQVPQSVELSVGITVRVVNTEGSALRARAEPTTGAEVVARFAPGTRLEIADGPRTADGYTWWYVRGDGGEGWCAADFLAPTL
jgi:hypothetical protein